MASTVVEVDAEWAVAVAVEVAVEVAVDGAMEVTAGAVVDPPPPVHAPRSTRPASTAPGGTGGRIGWARLGSNQRPTDYESAALTD